jgi:predicted esterase
VELTLLRPEWFAGAVAFGGRFPSIPNPLRRYCALQGKRVLLGTGVRDRQGAMRETAKLGHLLHLAGMEVTSRVYDAGHEVDGEMLLDVDRWLMEAICHPEPA